jgi:hypothetical protein
MCQCKWSTYATLIKCIMCALCGWLLRQLFHYMMDAHAPHVGVPLYIASWHKLALSWVQTFYLSCFWQGSPFSHSSSTTSLGHPSPWSSICPLDMGDKYIHLTMRGIGRPCCRPSIQKHFVSIPSALYRPSATMASLSVATRKAAVMMFAPITHSAIKQARWMITYRQRVLKLMRKVVESQRSCSSCLGYPTTSYCFHKRRSSIFWKKKEQARQSVSRHTLLLIQRVIHI